MKYYFINIIYHYELNTYYRISHDNRNKYALPLYTVPTFAGEGERVQGDTPVPPAGVPPAPPP